MDMKKNKKIVLIVGLVLAVICLIIVYGLIKSNSKNKTGQRKVDAVTNSETNEEINIAALEEEIHNNSEDLYDVSETVNNSQDEEIIKNGIERFEFNNGDIYEGEWTDNNINGTGKYTFADNAVLKGIFLNNVFISGTYTYTNKKGTFIITINNKKKTGEIKAKLSRGDIYKGKVKKGKFSGTCSITYYDGDKYKGKVYKNKKSGQGKYTWTEGDRYIGKWENDKMSGTGKYYYNNTKYPYLKGQFKKNKPCGNCVYYKNQNKKYNTVWKKGVCISITK